MTRLLAPGWAADGPCVERFAREAASWLGGEYGFAVNSGTSALHLALLAAGVHPGDDVLIPAYCCAALLNAVDLARARPVLVDVEPGGFNLCPEDAARRRTARTAAVVTAHMFGVSARVEPLLELGIPVVEDCAQSLGAVSGERPCGSRGLVAIGSFYATKVITTGHGGLVSTNDPDCAARLADWLHYDNREDWRPRFNYGMGETSAALGLWQLERLASFLERRQRIAQAYDTAFSAPQHRSAGAIAYRYVLRVRDAESAIGRLQERGIDAKRPVYRPLHHYLGGHYPHAQAAHEQIVSLPIYPELDAGARERVIAAVRSLGEELDWMADRIQPQSS